MERSLSLWESLAAHLLKLFNRVQFGDSFGPIMEAYLDIHGVRGFMAYAKLYDAIVNELAEVFGGPFEAQVIVAMAGFFNGCRFCTIGHLKAANLILYRDEERLSPIDEFYMVDLMYKTDEEVLEQLLAWMDGQERFERLSEALVGLYRMRFGDVEPSTDEEFLLVSAVAMWEWTNECTINMGADSTYENQVASGFSAGASLKRAYFGAREAQRAQRAIEAKA